MEELALINPRNITDKQAAMYSLREAARAVVLDENNLIGLLHVTRDSYYKLPGGGLEGKEDMLVALRRECQEEIGCEIEVLQELGLTTEYWKEDTEKQTSFCYLAKVIGSKGIPSLTESEKARGFETVWLSYSDALRTLKECKPTHWEGEYIVPRDLIFLTQAGNYINS